MRSADVRELLTSASEFKFVAASAVQPSIWIQRIQRPLGFEKQLLITHWGDWTVLKEKLPRSHARSLVDYLRVHPSDFRGAVARMRPEIRTLYMSGFPGGAVIHQRTLEVGARFLQKPFTPLSLARRVRETLDSSPES